MQDTMKLRISYYATSVRFVNDDGSHDEIYYSDGEYKHFKWSVEGSDKACSSDDLVLEISKQLYLKLKLFKPQQVMDLFYDMSKKGFNRKPKKDILIALDIRQ